MRAGGRLLEGSCSQQGMRPLLEMSPEIEKKNRNILDFILVLPSSLLVSLSVAMPAWKSECKGKTNKCSYLIL